MDSIKPNVETTRKLINSLSETISNKTPEDYIQELNESISYLKESSWTKDDRMMK